MSSVEVDSQDVIRLILQFCRENNLNATMAALQSESQVLLKPFTHCARPLRKQNNFPQTLTENCRFLSIQLRISMLSNQKKTF